MFNIAINFFKKGIRIPWGKGLLKDWKTNIQKMSLEHFSMPGNREYSKILRKTLQVTERKHAYLGFYHPIFFQKQYNENIKMKVKKHKTTPSG